MSEKDLKNAENIANTTAKELEQKNNLIANFTFENQNISEEEIDEEYDQLNINNEKNNIYSETVEYTNSIKVNIIEKAKKFLVTIKDSDAKDENKIKAIDAIIKKISDELDELDVKTKKVDPKIKNILKKIIKKCKSKFETAENLQKKITIFKNSIKLMEKYNNIFLNYYSGRLETNSKLEYKIEQINQNQDKNKKDLDDDKLNQDTETIETMIDENKENKETKETEENNNNEINNSNVETKIQNLKEEKNIIKKVLNLIKNAFLKLFSKKLDKIDNDVEQQQKENIELKK